MKRTSNLFLALLAGAALAVTGCTGLKVAASLQTPSITVGASAADSTNGFTGSGTYSTGTNTVGGSFTVPN